MLHVHDPVAENLGIPSTSDKNNHPLQPVITSCSHLLSLMGVGVKEIVIKRSENLPSDGAGKMRVHYEVDGYSLCTESYEHIANADRLMTVDLNEQIFNYSYDSMGRILASSRVDHKSPHSRVETFSYQYCKNGLLCQIDGPRTSVDDRLTIEYDDRAYFKRFRNANGIIFQAELEENFVPDRDPQRKNPRQDDVIEDDLDNAENALRSTHSSTRNSSDDSGYVSSADDASSPSKRLIGMPDTVVEVVARLGTDSPVGRYEHLARIEKDGFGRLENLVMDGQQSVLRYNEASQLILLGRPDGSSIAQEYDGSGRIVLQINTDESESSEVRFEYDSCEYGNGQLCMVSSKAVSSNYVYAESGYLRTIAVTRVSGTQLATFEYDSLGSVKSLHYPGGMKVEYSNNDSIPSVKVTLSGSNEFELKLGDMWNPLRSGQNPRGPAVETKSKKSLEESIHRAGKESLISYLGIKTLDDSKLPNAADLHREKVYLPDGRILYELLYEDPNQLPRFRRAYIWYDETMIAFSTESLFQPVGDPSLHTIHYKRQGVPSSIRDSEGNIVAEIQIRGIKEHQHTMRYSPRIPSPDQLALAPSVHAYHSDNCLGPSHYMNQCLAYWSGFRSYAQPSGYVFIPPVPGEGGGVFIPTFLCVEMSSDACPGASGGTGGGGGGGSSGQSIPYYTIDHVPVIEIGVAEPNSNGRIVFGSTNMEAAESLECEAVEGSEYKLVGHATLGIVSIQVMDRKKLPGCTRTPRDSVVKNITIKHEQVHAQKILDVINNANNDSVLGEMFGTEQQCTNAMNRWKRDYKNALDHETKRQQNHCDHIGQYQQELTCKLSTKVTGEKTSTTKKYPDPGSRICG